MKAVSGLESERDDGGDNDVVDDGRGLQTTSNFNLSKSLECREQQAARVGNGKSGVDVPGVGVKVTLNFPIFHHRHFPRGVTLCLLSMYIQWERKASAFVGFCEKTTLA